jgi:hypothetical protein
LRIERFVLDIPSPDSAPAALADLIAAGLVSHEMIGDPSRLSGEAEALRSLCAIVPGAIWRIEPFHYAFRVGPGDLRGAGLEDDASADRRAAALEAALQDALGADAVWVNAADLMPAATAQPGAPAVPEAALLLLRARADATEAALEAAGTGIQAVIDARFAAAAARLATGFGAADAAPLAERLTAIEARQSAILAALEADAARAGEERAARDAALDRLAGAVAALAGRIDAEAARDTAREAATLAGLASFRDTVGLVLAEFLAGLEQRGETPLPLRVPQFS